MTTPTREQVVREAFEKWYCESTFDLAGQPTGSRACSQQWGAWKAARADLEATIAEQVKETVERQADHLKLVEENHELRQQLSASQSREVQLRELMQQEINYHFMQAGPKDLPNIKKAIAIPNDDTALREYGAKLVERIADDYAVPAGVTVRKFKEIADKIRKGEFQHDPDR
jgi:hypothetical protein